MVSIRDNLKKILGPSPLLQPKEIIKNHESQGSTFDLQLWMVTTTTFVKLGSIYWKNTNLYDDF